MTPTRPAFGLLCIVSMCWASMWLVSASASQQAEPASVAPAWADWVEPDFPFFSSVLDAPLPGPSTELRAGGPSSNLTPRALVLNLGHDRWAGFDVDLLRVAAMWRGRGVTPKALAPGSYHAPDRKTPGGQFPAPGPDGTIWVRNGIYPGWQATAEPTFIDPREPAPSPEEVGRGPLPEAMGRFKAIRLIAGGAVLEYTVSGVDVRERMALSDRSAQPAIVRHLHVAPSPRTLWLVLGFTAPETTIALSSAAGARPTLETLNVPAAGARTGETIGMVRAVRVPPHSEPVEFSVVLGDTAAPPGAMSAIPTAPSTSSGQAPPPRRWTASPATTITRSRATTAFVVDDVALPLDNPWRRNIRPGDIQFFKNGTAAVVTLDGDVWTVSGLSDPDGGTVRWRRFASGLHEPLTLAIRDDEVYVFDRNGIWRLRDTNGDGEADVHELFSNAFAQTADMREFPSTIRLGPGGEFVIAKGGQEATTLGKHNGSVLRISADGRQATVLGYGLRQPNISVNPKTGLVIASDQQGHYIPSTPLHVVRDGQFYGFLSDKRPREVYPAPIAEPITWIPHAVNASAMSQVWMTGSRMGPLDDGLVHIGFNNPELFRVLLNTRTPRLQAAVVSITRAFDFPPLNGSIDPADGQLYIAGFQILGWGTTATRLAGIGRVRYTGAVSTMPREVVPMAEGILLRFDTPLNPVTAANADNYSVTSWNYRRTYQYGSPQYKSNGSLGIDRLVPSHAYVSKDGRSVFVSVPAMAPVMQMRIGWSLATADGTTFDDSAHFTPYELPRFDPAAEGFGMLTVDRAVRSAAPVAAAPITIEEGRRLSQLYGCVACHSIDPSRPMLGPTWKGLYGRQRTFANNIAPVVADESYLREAILEPAAKIVSGFERGEGVMPSYAGVLTTPQIDAILLFIKSLN